MNQAHQDTITAPGVSVVVGPPPDFTQQVNSASYSAAVTFDAVKHLLSNRPPRVPNRRRPIDDK